MKTIVSSRTTTLALSQALFLLFAAAWPGTAATAPAAPAMRSVDLMMTFDPSIAADPQTDVQPRLIQAAPIRLQLESKTKNPENITGRLSVRVNEDGTIERLRFDTARPEKKLAAGIEAAMPLWRFAPMTRENKPVAAWVQLIFSTAEVPAVDADSPPRVVFATLPGYPGDLRRPWARTGAATPVVSIPTDRAPVSKALGTNAPAIGEGYEPYAPVDGRTVRSGNRTNFAGTDTAPWFSGHVMMRVDVSEFGTVSNPEIVRSTGSCFEPHAVSSVLQWVFAPAVRAGMPVATRMVVPVGLPGVVENPPPLLFKPDPESSTSWDEPPRLRHLDLPIYPQDLLKAGVAGRASARVTLDANGVITEVELIDCTNPEFGLALTASIRRCQHDAARRSGHRVPASLIRTAVFDPRPWSTKPIAGETPALPLRLEDDVAPCTEESLDEPLHALLEKPLFVATDSVGASSGGSATVQFIVSSLGAVREPHIVEASDSEAAYAAVQAISAWLFQPPIKQGIATPVVTQVTFP